MLKLTDEAKKVEPIAGVPWRDMTDEEFEAVQAEYDAQFSPDQAGSLSRWFERVDDTTTKAKAKKGAAAQQSAGGDD